ncbi:hypothetical protein FNH22_28795 [Fulvivirga sp. M361]|uniref:hypothetical protein n=1 Tax=Fulvivirga sp. M361 TaxID=2594266 RepID=UPI001179E001|nr:hypothetical protein [Fulvivirga sp. M361]TRX48594.1 hypothetical protein FNH22_28795 [Fulvivirga sp. M361]
MQKFIVFVFLLGTFSFRVSAQLVTDLEDESKLYAQTKQVGQFFRRFNGEEDENGDRYYPKDKKYRSQKLRKSYLGLLFDRENTSIKNELKVAFAKEMLDKDQPRYLDFHGGQWYAEVNALFRNSGKKEIFTLFMKLEKDRLGSKWVIEGVAGERYDRHFEKAEKGSKQFLHPMSHELSFMNLRKAFDEPDSISEYTTSTFEPDYLTLFIYELELGKMKFETVQHVKFHFFQLDNWYFELSNFNRPGYNTGWLISNLVQVNEETSERLKKHLFYEQ